LRCKGVIVKTLFGFTAAVLLGVSSVAVAQVNLPAPNSPGMSPDSAVELLAPSDLMVDRYIKRWLQMHYPDWTAEPHQFMEIGSERYAVVYITSANAPARRIYFRVKKNPMEDDSSPFPLG
jgi:hypothetical protein